jgi:hypothetical protein
MNSPQTGATQVIGTPAVQANQSGDWTVDAVQSGTWTVDATQSGTWTVDAAQSGTWTVTATPPAITVVTNSKSLATSAATAILSTAYTAPAAGTLNVAVGIASGDTATTFSTTRDGTNYLAVNQGTDLVAGAEYDFSLPVASGDTINFETAAATTLAVLEVFFVPTQ